MVRGSDRCAHLEGDESSMYTLPIWVGWLFGVFLTVAFGAASYTLADYLIGERPTRLRLVAASLTGFFLQGGAFYILMATGTFALPGALVVGLLMAAGAGMYGYLRPGFTKRLLEDVGEGRRFGKWVTTGRTLWLTVAASVVGGGQLVRALVAPPMAWDSLTYQLVRPALWIQNTGFAEFGAPGLWPTYASRLPLGNALSAWAMLPVASDIFVPVVWAGVWFVMIGGVYSFARQLGVAREEAYASALVSGFVPAVSAHAFVAHVDNAVAALVVLSACMMVEAVGDQRSGETPKRTDPGVLWSVVLVVAGSAAAIAVKKTGVILYVPWVAAAAWGLRRNRGRVRSWATIAIAVGATIAMIGPPVVYLWVTYGSPVFPHELAIGDHVLFEGGGFPDLGDPMLASAPRTEVVSRLFWKGYGSPLHHVNFGICVPILLIAGTYRAVRQLLQGRHRVVIGTVVLVAWATLGLLVAQPTGSGLNIARYFVGAQLLVIGMVGLGGGKWTTRLLYGAFVVHCVYALPFEWAGVGFEASAGFLLAAVPFGLVAGVVYLYVRRADDRTWAKGLVGILLTLAASLGTVLEPIRSLYRHDFYQMAAVGESFTNMPLGGNHGQTVMGAPIWEFLDEPSEGVKVSVTVGWDGRGINWFVYPLFGRRLQNRVTYTPVTADGTVAQLGSEGARASRADYESWRKRLDEHDIDFVAAFGPPPLEVRWMEENHSTFELVKTGLTRQHRLYRIVDTR